MVEPGVDAWVSREMDQESRAGTAVGCGGPPTFGSPFRWGQADAKPPKRATESRWAITGARSMSRSFIRRRVPHNCLSACANLGGDVS